MLLTGRRSVFFLFCYRDESEKEHNFSCLDKIAHFYKWKRNNHGINNIISWQSAAKVFIRRNESLSNLNPVKRTKSLDSPKRFSHKLMNMLHFLKASNYCLIDFFCPRVNLFPRWIFYVIRSGHRKTLEDKECFLIVDGAV